MTVIRREAREPLYWQIKKILISRIANMQQNALFSSEHDLAEEFEVSRGTVKQAIVELVNEGYLYRIQGKGTFVSPPRIVRGFGVVPSFTEDIRQKGYEPKSVIRAFTLETPTEKIQHALNLPPEVLVWKIERVVMADDVAVSLVTSYLRSDVYPNLDEHKSFNSLYGILSKYYGKVPVFAKDTYESQVATSYLVNALSVHSGDPVLYSERIAFLDSEMPVEYVQSYMRGDRFTIQVQIPQEGDAHGSPVGIRPRYLRR